MSTTPTLTARAIAVHEFQHLCAFAVATELLAPQRYDTTKTVVHVGFGEGTAAIYHKDHTDDLQKTIVGIGALGPLIEAKNWRDILYSRQDQTKKMAHAGLSEPDLELYHGIPQSAGITLRDLERVLSATGFLYKDVSNPRLLSLIETGELLYEGLLLRHFIRQHKATAAIQKADHSYRANCNNPIKEPRYATSW